MFNRVTIHNHFHINIGDKLMATFEELLAKVDTIATAESVESVKADLAVLSEALTVNTQADLENAQNDAAIKLTADQNRVLLEAILNKLAESTPPTP
jgi:hypothetical protein